MKEVLVVGIGSRIMMDDGIGIYLVEDLKQHIINPNIEFILGETDIDYCLSEISKCNHIVIADAYLSDKDPGKVTVIRLCDLKRRNNISCSLHGMHFLNMFKYLQNVPEGIFIGIEPYEINYGLCLSDILQKCYPLIYRSVYEHVSEYINSMEG